MFSKLHNMVRAWYMDKAPGDQRLEHRAKGTADIPLDRLASLGVLYWKVSPRQYPLSNRYFDVIIITHLPTIAGCREL